MNNNGMFIVTKKEQNNSKVESTLVYSNSSMDALLKVMHESVSESGKMPMAKYAVQSYEDAVTLDEDSTIDCFQ